MRGVAELLVCVVTGLLVVVGCSEEKTSSQEGTSRETQFRKRLDDGLASFAGGDWPKLSEEEGRKLREKLQADNETMVLDIVKVASSREALLRDGRSLKLAYIKESDDPARREQARTLLEKWLVGSNFVACTRNPASDPRDPPSVIKNTSTEIVATVSLHTGSFILADLGNHLLYNGLVDTDESSDYKKAPLYQLNVEYLKKKPEP